MARQDPAADIRIRLECPQCSRVLSVVFDIVAVLWTELGVYAKRLLRQVDVLARRYGWTESEILSLSPARRAFYLALTGSS
jgi:hypothetical protein